MAKTPAPSAATPEATTDQLQELRDKLDTLTIRQRQLHALLMMTFGEAAESFSSLMDEDRDFYMWACTDMARSCADMGAEAETMARAARRA